MKRLFSALLAASWLLGLATGLARAHFQVLLPSTDVVSAADDKTVRLDILFTHPMEQAPVMEMARPRQFGVLVGGKKVDLLGELKSRKLEGKTAYTAAVRLTQPGDYVFFLEPAPYWEPAEAKMIVHYTKVVVNALGDERGWDALVGLPVEIEPLVRPYGLWTGNTFRGIVRRGGKPVPLARVEVEYYNLGRRVQDAQRRLRHAGGQGRRQRRVFLHHAAGRLVGIRRDGARRAENEEPRRQAGRRGTRRPDLGENGGYGGEEKGLGIRSHSQIMFRKFDEQVSCPYSGH